MSTAADRLDRGHQPQRKPAGVRARWRRFAARYGWRAYAVPVLAVLTVVALVQGAPTGAGHRSGSVAEAPRSSTGAAGRAAVQVEGFDAGSAAYRPAVAPVGQTIQLGGDTTSCAENGYPKLILVSITEQRLWACLGHRQVNSTPVTTGSSVDHDQTPPGSWRVVAKQRDRYLVGPGYRDYVKYWVPFFGDFGLHDASWQTMPFGSPDYRTQGSHGCVHVPLTVMAWIYGWVVPGHTVVTVVR